MDSSPDIIELSPKRFLAGCAVAAVIALFVGFARPFPAWVLAAELMITILALFVLGSIRYRLDKNALTFGAFLVIAATFAGAWWPDSGIRADLQVRGGAAILEFVHHHFLTLHGLENLIHADTMLFILGLTFFVAVIAQTHLLESVSFFILTRLKGDVFRTLVLLTGIVSVASGILDGVSMIGLTIRTTVIILALSATNGPAQIYCVLVSTLITTVCGMWLAYGEPPNLIMKANLHPHLNDAFFLRYCLPLAVISYLIIAWNMRKHLKGRYVAPSALEEARKRLDEMPGLSGAERKRMQLKAVISFVPFIGLLIGHALNHAIPLFLASFAGFAAAFPAIARDAKRRKTALHDARHEYAEYYFLFPLFFSIALLQRSGFFSQLSALLHTGIETLGASHVAWIQFAAATFLSAILDNNVVADFAGRAIGGLPVQLIYYFAMAQIAGYALGGCWTHIGSAQSVVAYSYVTKEIEPKFTPFQWIQAMTPVILQIFAAATAYIYLVSRFH